MLATANEPHWKTADLDVELGKDTVDEMAFTSHNSLKLLKDSYFNRGAETALTTITDWIVLRTLRKRTLLHLGASAHALSL